MSKAFDIGAGMNAWGEGASASTVPEEGLPDVEEAQEQEAGVAKGVSPAQRAESLAGSLCSECQLAIVWKDGCKVPDCKLCGIKSSAATPLVLNRFHPPSGGLVPWREYSKVKDELGDVTGKTPKGRLCALSFVLYESLGLGVKFGLIPKFLEGVAQKKPDHLQALSDLQESHKAWLKRHTKDPEVVHLNLRKTTAGNVQQELLVVSSRKSRFKKPKNSLF